MAHLWVLVSLEYAARDKLQASRRSSRFRDEKRDCFAVYILDPSVYKRFRLHDFGIFIRLSLIFVFKEERKKEDFEG